MQIWGQITWFIVTLLLERGMPWGDWILPKEQVHNSIMRIHELKRKWINISDGEMKIWRQFSWFSVTLLLERGMPWGGWILAKEQAKPYDWPISPPRKGGLTMYDAAVERNAITSESFCIVVKTTTNQHEKNNNQPHPLMVTSGGTEGRVGPKKKLPRRPGRFRRAESRLKAPGPAAQSLPQRSRLASDSLFTKSPAAEHKSSR